jgi:hypothetical protein
MVFAIAPAASATARQSAMEDARLSRGLERRARE